MNSYQVIMNIDIDKDRQANLFIISSSFEYARRIAGEILIEKKDTEVIEVQILELEEEQLAYCYSGNGIRH